jgi:hypothetical protein
MSKHSKGVIEYFLSEDDDSLLPPKVIRSTQREFNDHFGHEEDFPVEMLAPYEYKSSVKRNPSPVFSFKKVSIAPPPLPSFSSSFLTEDFSSKPGSGKSLPDLAAILKSNVSERVQKLQEKRRREDEEKAAALEEEMELREARIAEARSRKLKAERETAEELARLAIIKHAEPRKKLKLSSGASVSFSAASTAGSAAIALSESAAESGAGAGRSGGQFGIVPKTSSGIHSLKDFKNARENDNFKNSAVGVIHGFSFRLVFPRNSCHTLTDRGSRWAAMQRGVDKTSPKSFECVLARNFEHFQYILARANGGNEKFAGLVVR